VRDEEHAGNDWLLIYVFAPSVTPVKPQTSAWQNKSGIKQTCEYEDYQVSLRLQFFWVNRSLGLRDSFIPHIRLAKQLTVYVNNFGAVAFLT